MKTSKKILGVLLALVMIFNVFAMVSFAAFPDDAAVKLMIRADKESYKPGDTVTITFSEQVLAEVGAMRIGGQYEIAYPSSTIVPFASTSALADHGFAAIQSGVDTSMSEVYFEQNDPSTNSYNWDKTIAIGLGDDLSTSFAATDGVDLFTITMKISDTAADGTYTIGYNPAAYEGYSAYSNDAKNGGLYGTSASEYGFSVPNMYEYGTCEIKVASADAEPTIVNPLKGQIRFDKKDGAYAGTFDVRALATITEEDFNATFKDAATAEDMIEEIGFVFAAGSNVGTPDMAGVKALVENGTALSGYEKKTVDYISTGAANVAAGNYVFSCIVTDIPDADKADSLVAVGYIKWTDAEGTHYNYYPAAQEISFNALYTAHYNSAFPQA